MVSEFQENKFKIAQQNFQKIIKDILENPSVFDHYMINMGGQRPKAGSN